MAEKKYLDLNGLGYTIRKMDAKKADIESPVFTGTPTVNGEEIVTKSDLTELNENITAQINILDSDALKGSVDLTKGEEIPRGSATITFTKQDIEDVLEYVPADADQVVPRQLQNRVTDTLGGNEFVEKTQNVDEITINSNSFTIRDSSAQDKIDMSGTATHGVIENMRFSAFDAGIKIDKATGWSGSNKFRNLFFYGCEYPITLYSSDTTDTYFENITIENARQGIRINTQATFRNLYIGDNQQPVDAENPDCAFLIKSKANINIESSTLGCGVRDGSESNVVFKFDTTEDAPAYVELDDSCCIAIPNQNLEGRSYGAMADLSNKNDRFFIDNCRFDVYPLRVNYNHNVAPYLLKPFKTIWSKKPFFSYVCGGKMESIDRSFPKHMGEVTKLDTQLVNPFGGNIVKLSPYKTEMFYHIPRSLIGQTMYIHAYVGTNGTQTMNFRIARTESDCSETTDAWLNQGRHAELTPYLNIIPFTPTKEKGKIAIRIGSTDIGVLCGLFLVESHNKEMLCDYADYDEKTYADALPSFTGDYGELVYSNNQEETNCDGWRYTNSWTPFTLGQATGGTSSDNTGGTDYTLIIDTTVPEDTTRPYVVNIPNLQHIKVSLYHPDGIFTSTGYFFTEQDWGQGVYIGGETLIIAQGEFDCGMHVMRCVASPSGQAYDVGHTKFLQHNILTKLFVTPNAGSLRGGTRIIVKGK